MFSDCACYSLFIAAGAQRQLVRVTTRLTLLFSTKTRTRSAYDTNNYWPSYVLRDLYQQDRPPLLFAS